MKNLKIIKGSTKDLKQKESSIKTIGLNVPMHEELMLRINKAALERNLTKAAYVRMAIEEKLKKDGF